MRPFGTVSLTCFAAQGKTPVCLLKAGREVTGLHPALQARMQCGIQCGVSWSWCKCSCLSERNGTEAVASTSS